MVTEDWDDVSHGGRGDLGSFKTFKSNENQWTYRLLRYNLEKLIETGNKRIKNVYNIYMYIYGVCSWNSIKIKVFDITRR